MARDSKCILCGRCAETCEYGAIRFDEKKGRIIDRVRCNLCFKCVDVCPSGALARVGEYRSVEEIMSEIDKDEVFYLKSGGGVTVSGGEPLLQQAFLIDLLRACKERGYHTALDTCGYASWDGLRAVLRYVDLVLYDIKHLDEGEHRQGTGKGNKLILSNARKISSYAEIWLRVPLIPGYNDSYGHLREVGRLGKEIGATKISILSFNRVGEGKCRGLGKAFPAIGDLELTEDRIQEIEKIFQSIQLEVTFGT
jgi:pyruvate formate lyase activating enzyme